MKYLLVNTNIKIRYILTILTSFFVAGINFYIQILISRELAVDVYGEYLFILGVFLSFIPFFELGTGQAFFTFISQEKHSKRFYLYYFSWVIVQFIVALLFIFVLSSLNILNSVFFTENIELILLVFLFSFLSVRVVSVLKYIYESKQLSNISQLFITLIAITNIICIMLLSYTQMFSLINILYINIAVFAVYQTISMIYIHKNNIIVFTNTNENFKEIFYKFYLYSFPLIFASLIGFINTYFFNWFTMNYGGSEERAYFGIAERISMVVLLFTSAMVNIFWREISSSFKSDKKHMEKTINNVQNMFLIFTVFCTIFLLFYTEDILYYSFGDKYMSALFTLKLFFISVIFTSQLQLLGTVTTAVSLTKLSFYFTLVATVLRIVFVYVALYMFSNLEVSTMVIVTRLIVLILSLFIVEFIIYKKLELNYSLVWNKYIIAFIIIVFLYMSYYILNIYISNHLYLLFSHIGISLLFFIYSVYQIYTQRIIFGIRILS